VGGQRLQLSKSREAAVLLQALPLARVLWVLLLTWSSVLMSGERPPCTHSTLPSINACGARRSQSRGVRSASALQGPAASEHLNMSDQTLRLGSLGWQPPLLRGRRSPTL
jgi:hypothetical protein